MHKRLYSCNGLAEAHLLALEELYKNQTTEIYNIGNNQGFSVNEIIKSVEEITQKKINIERAGRRKGDPALLVADNQKIKSNLNWSAQYSDLKTIIFSAWQWENTLLRLNN